MPNLESVGQGESPGYRQGRRGLETERAELGPHCFVFTHTAPGVCVWARGVVKEPQFFINLAHGLRSAEGQPWAHMGPQAALK